jgi:hypothetical protein
MTGKMFSADIALYGNVHHRAILQVAAGSEKAF